MIYFCESYITVENALYLIDRNSSNLIIVVIGNKDLYKLFLDIKTYKRLDFRLIFIPIIQIKNNPVKRIVNEKLYLIRCYKKYFKSIYNTHIYFSTQYYAPYTYYFIRKLNARNNLVFLSPQNYDEYKPISTNFKIRRFLYNLYFYFCFGPDIRLKKFKIREEIPYLNDEFILKRCDKIINSKERAELINPDKLYHKYNAWNFNFRLLYFDTPFSRINIKADPFEIKDIFSTINEIMNPSKVGIKLHPGEKIPEDLYEIYKKTGIIIPRYIMGQFLLTNKKVRFSVGYSSTILFNNTTSINISLLKIINFLPQLKKAELIEYTNKRTKTEILFPNTLRDLKNVLSN